MTMERLGTRLRIVCTALQDYAADAKGTRPYGRTISESVVRAASRSPAITTFGEHPHHRHCWGGV